MRRSRPKAPLERTEIAGTVAAVGSAVSRHRAGDRVRAGCFVDSCRECDQGLAGQEQFRTGTGGSTATH